MSHRIPRVVFYVSLLLSLAGCGTFSDYLKGDDNAAPPTPLADIKTTLRVSTGWSENIGKSDKAMLINLRPAAADGRLYIASSGGQVSALDANTGKTLWRTQTSTRLGGGPGVGDGLVIVGSREGEVFALSATDGKELWHSRVTSEVLSVPAAASGVVVARAIDGRLFGLSAVDGKRLWTHDRTVPVLTLRGSSSPVLYRGLVVYGSDSGRLTALLLKKGFPVWERSIAFPSGRSELDRIVDIDGDPLILDDIVYAASYQGSIAALDIRTSKTLWKRNFSSFNGMSADKSNLYVTDDEGNVWALDRRSGASLWKQDQLLNRQVSGPAVLGEYVVVGDFEGYLHWMSVEDGRFVARIKVAGSGIDSQPLSDGKQIYSYSKDGTLTASSVQ